MTKPDHPTIAQAGKVIVFDGGRGNGKSRSRTIVDAPTLTITATAAGGWSRLVAILTATTLTGKTIVVSGGGVPTRPGKHTYTIRMISQMTFIPAGARLFFTLGSSSLAQDPGNLLYLQLPMPSGARLTVDVLTAKFRLETAPGF